MQNLRGCEHVEQCIRKDLRGCEHVEKCAHNFSVSRYDGNPYVNLIGNLIREPIREPLQGSRKFREPYREPCREPYAHTLSGFALRIIS